MALVPEYRITPEEYLRVERAAATKSEYDDGVIYSMSGASFPHNLIVAGLIRSLGNRLPAGCRVAPSDLKIRILNPTRFYYPDASVICGTPRFADDEKDVLLNPLIVFEVLSESTAAFDRGRKFHSYQSLESLHEYVLVSQDRYLVEHFRRDGEHWLYTPAKGRDANISLPAANCELPLAEIYYQVDIDAAEA
jgi:Uma2 family endonuclease